MKKIAYSLLTVVVFLVGFIKVDAQMITFDELKEQGKVIVNNVEETDNIYVVGDRIFTNFITLANIEAAGKTKDDVIKFNTSETKWTYVDETKELDTSAPVVVKYDKEGKQLEIDYIHNAEELEYALSEENEAVKLVLAEDITDVKRSFEIKKEITIDGNNKTISVSKKAQKYFYGIEECFSIIETRARFINIGIKGFYTGFYLDKSILDLEGNINLTDNEFGGIVLEDKNSSLDATKATLTYSNEEFYNPLITIYDVEEKTDGTIVKANGLTERFDPYYEESSFYLNKDNIYYANVETQENKSFAVEDNDRFNAYLYANATVSNAYNTNVTIKVSNIKFPEGAEGNLYVYNDDNEEYVEVKDGDLLFARDLSIGSIYEALSLQISSTKTGNFSCTVTVYNDKDEVIVEKEITTVLKDTVLEAFATNFVVTNPEILPTPTEQNGAIFISTNKEIDAVLEVNITGEGKATITNIENEDINGMNVKLKANDNTYIPILIETETAGDYNVEITLKQNNEVLDDTKVEFYADQLDEDMVPEEA